MMMKTFGKMVHIERFMIYAFMTRGIFLVLKITTYFQLFFLFLFFHVRAKGRVGYLTCFT
jgi:hypothetical protein